LLRACSLSFSHFSVPKSSRSEKPKHGVARFVSLGFGKLDRIMPHANELAAVCGDNTWAL
jgi:hypothetical protein